MARDGGRRFVAAQAMANPSDIYDLADAIRAHDDDAAEFGGD